jgi:hypothetical protein
VLFYLESYDLRHLMKCYIIYTIVVWSGEFRMIILKEKHTTRFIIQDFFTFLPNHYIYKFSNTSLVEIGDQDLNCLRRPEIVFCIDPAIQST